MRFKKILFSVLITMVIFNLFGCGGGGGGSENKEQRSSNIVSSQASSSSSSSSSSEIDLNIQKYTESNPGEGIWGIEYRANFAGLFIDGINFYNSDGTHGTTKLIDDGSSFNARDGGTTYFKLGSIEFYPVPSSRIVSIFNLLRNYNHQSNEVINLVRLLMLLDSNSSGSRHISISEKAKEQLKFENIELSDLSVNIDEFARLSKITSLALRLNSTGIPSVSEAKAYISDYFYEELGYDRYSQWLGKEHDFDFDGVINSKDDFPWDNSQWRDVDDNAIGDDAIVNYKFIETRGVVKFLIDKKNRILYVANYNKKLSRFDLPSGRLLSEITFENFITSLDINEENGDVFISTAEAYIYSTYLEAGLQKGNLFVIHAGSSAVNKVLMSDIYIRDIKVTNGRLLISALNTDSHDARVVVFDTHNYGLLQDLRYWGEGGRIVSGTSKFIVIDYNIYSVFTINEIVAYYGQGGLNGWFPTPVFIDERFDSLIDVNGWGFRLSLKNGESQISDDGIFYINYQYIDTENFRVSPRVDLIKEDYISNQYFALGANTLFYVNRDTFLVSGIKYFNRFSGIASYVQRAKKELAVLEDIVYVVTELSNGATQISSFNHPCMHCGVSNAPVAEVAIAKNYVDVQEPIQLNAQSSYDKEDGDKLLFRWDLNSDGVWDTNFTFNNQYTVKFETSGKKVVTLQVKDSSGLVAEKSITLDLSFGTYSGELPESEKLEELDLLVEDAEFDQLNGIVYLTSPETLSIFAIDANSGKVIRQYKFKYQPTQMAISSEENILYVGFNAKGCFSGPPFDCEKDLIGPENGFILKFDLNRKKFIESFDVNVPPADLYIKGNQLFVSAHYWFKHVSRIEFEGGIDIYDTITGEYVDHVSTSSGANTFFDKILKVTDAPIFDLEQHSLAGIKYVSDEQKTVVYSFAQYMQHFWLLPNSDLVLNQAGEIRDIKTMELIQNLPYVSSGYIHSISFDVDKSLMVVGSTMGVTTPTGGALDYFDLVSLEHLGTTATDNWPDWTFFNNGKLIAIERIENYQYKVNLFDTP